MAAGLLLHAGYDAEQQTLVDPMCGSGTLAIEAALAPYLLAARRVLEVGSGAGQHALHICASRPWLQWQCTELPGRIDDLAANCSSAGLPAPVVVDVASSPWPVPAPTGTQRAPRPRACGEPS